MSDQIVIINFQLSYYCGRVNVLNKSRGGRNPEFRDKENWKHGNCPSGYKCRTDFLQLHD